MAELFNIYCDESCHLEHDQIPVMVLGAVWCPAALTKEVADRLREIKESHGLLARAKLASSGTRPFEAKWSKVSPARVDFYRALVDYFFENDHLHFRGVLIDKAVLDHAARGQTHDEWYYKMMFTLLEPLIVPVHRYRVYLDIKDTRSESRRATLERVLRSTRHDYEGGVIDRVQQIRSHESELMQLADLLIGAVAFHNRVVRHDLPRGSGALSPAKLALVDQIRKRSCKTLEHTTWLRESKFNLLRWEPGRGRQ